MNSKKRFIKRLVIIFVYLAIAGLFFGAIYYILVPQETCFDGIKNQSEENIDCGGECSPCEELKYEELKVLKSGMTESGLEDKIDIFLQIENPNSHLGVKEVDYEIEILGDNGVVLGNATGSSFFLPHEKKTLIENNLDIDENEVKKIRWKVLNIEWANFDSSFENPQFKIVNKKLDFDFSISSASGILVNKSPYDFSLIGIKVILKDSEDRIRFINTTEMRTVKSGEEREFKAIWPGRLPDDIIKMEVESEVNIFDPQSFFRQYYEIQKFQEVSSSEN